MKKRMKKVATLCLAGVTAMSTVGVTGSAVFAKGDTNYDVDNMDFENVELRVAFRFNNGSDTDGQAKWYYKALEEFNKENEGKIHVTDESISTESDYEEKLTTDFASGNVPNAFLQYGGSRTREYVDAGYILDAEKVTIDTGNYLLDDVNAIMAENTESKLEIPTYDSNTAAMDTIRNSLQALATGASAQEVGDDIVDKMSAYE